MKKNLYIGLGVIFLYFSWVNAVDRFGRNELFLAVQNNDTANFVRFSGEADDLVATLDSTGVSIPRYDLVGCHFLHIVALHARTPDILRLGIEMFLSRNLGIDELEQPSRFFVGGASALHYVYRREHCSPELRLSLIKEFLDCGASPFLESLDNRSDVMQNAYELTLNLGKISQCKPWVVCNKARIRKIFLENIRYVLLHRLFSSYNLSELSKEKTQRIIELIFAQDDACALVVVLFWLRSVEFPCDLPRASRCAKLLQNADLLQSAKDLYRQSVVIPGCITTLKSKLPRERARNIVDLLRARQQGR